MFEDNPLEFDNYFNQLLTLAQAGLVPENAQAIHFFKCIATTKNDIIEKKSGEVKIHTLSYWVLAIKLGKFPMAVALILKLLNYYLPNFDAIKNLGILQIFFFSFVLVCWVYGYRLVLGRQC